jgi:hypothetical protein
MHRRTKENACAFIWRAAKSHLGSEQFNTTVKNSHATAFETLGVETLVQMIDVQKYALSTLNLVASNMRDSTTFSSQ